MRFDLFSILLCVILFAFGCKVDESSMKDAKKQIVIVSYDHKWPEIFKQEAGLVRKILGSNCLQIEHIGSTSVPGLPAKPVIDMLVIVKNLDLVQEKQSISKFESLNYEYKSELNIPFRLYFSKIDEFPPKTHLHIYQGGDHGIQSHILFRNYLISNPNAKEEYAKLKIDLAKRISENKNTDNSDSQKTFLGEYCLGKDDFIRKILKLAGYNGTQLRICSHSFESDEYYRILKEQLKYEKNEIEEENCIHFVLFKGLEIVSVAMVENLDKEKISLKFIATDEKFHDRGHEIQLIKLLEKWANFHKKQLLLTNVNKSN